MPVTVYQAARGKPAARFCTSVGRACGAS